MEDLVEARRLVEAVEDSTEASVDVMQVLVDQWRLRRGCLGKDVMEVLGASTNPNPNP